MHRCIPFVKLILAGLVLFAASCTDDSIKIPESNDPKVRKLKLPPGFFAERLYSPSEAGTGSWVSMTFDDKGRMIASDQYGSLYRLTLPPIGDTTEAQVEKLIVGAENLSSDSVKSIGMGYAQGLLYAFNSLYVMVNHRANNDFEKGSGLYRLQDTDGDDQFDKVTLLKTLAGEGEHGPHSIILSPDKKSLYVVIGNHTDLPAMNSYLLPSNWQEDNILPLITDPNGHAVDRKAPGGWIAHVDSLGQQWELVGGGLRNTFDIAFNERGDLFAYDSDMEWDFGMPWYRPTRILHVTSGSDFGWRTGTGKWSPEYPDNLPALLNIGQGSPTNLVYAGNAKFPSKYKNSLLAFDWSFGIIYSIRLEPDGATYNAKAEEFVSGAPLPLTDGVIGPDGALYFLTGGRRLESDLYRVSYMGRDVESGQADYTLSEVQQLRRQLESYHTAKEGAIEFAWPYLHHDDRFIRYAARIAVEHQLVAEWQDRVLQEKEPITLIQGAVALARNANKEVQPTLLQALLGIDYDKLSEPYKIELLRAYELAFARMGQPAAETREQIIRLLDAKYPAATNNLNRELSKLLVFLDAPHVVEKTVALMQTSKDDPDYQKTFTESADLIFRNPQYGLDIANMLAKVPPAQQTYLVTALSEAKSGWTPELRDTYFSWFSNTFQHYKGGVSFVGFINKARTMALENVPKDMFAHYNAVSGDSLVTNGGRSIVRSTIQPKGPGRNWKVDEAVAVVENDSTTRNFAMGKAMFDATLCSSCHGMRGEGVNVGPDLTQLGTRFSIKDMLEAIIEPNKTISDQYAATVFTLKGGNTVVGRLIREDENNYYVSQNPFTPQTLREVPKPEVTGTKLSDVSIMLPGMINRLNPEELKDLMAYLMAGGNEEHSVYNEKKK